MAKDLLIRLEARDNASAVFERTGRSGRKMGEDIEQGAEGAADALDELDRAQDDVGQSAVDMVLDVGRAADELGRELPQGAERAERALENLDRAQDEAGQSATELSRDVEASGRSLRDFGDAGQQVGAGLALLGTSFAMYSSQLVENQRQVSLLQRIYGDAAGGLQAFAEQIQKTTTYSSESAVAAANALGTLTLNYGVGVDKIRELMTISTDLAATSGLTLEDTASRVAAAVRGETEAAEWLNLTLNQQAIDIDGVTLSMSNQAAGLYRINALTEQATFAQGAAAEQAQTTAGHFKQLANSTNDTIRSFVEFTGPVGQAAGVISKFGLEAGLALSGTVALAKGLRELRTASQGVGALGTTFGLLTNPITLVGVAVAGMTAIAIKNIADHDNAAKELQATYEEVAKTIRELPLADIQQGRIQTALDEVHALDSAYDDMFANIAAEGDFHQRFITDTSGRIQQQVLTTTQLTDELASGMVDITEAERLIEQALTAEGANVNALIPSIENAIALHQLWIETNGQAGISGETLITMLQQMAAGADTWGEAIQNTTDDLITFSDQITVTEQALEDLIRTGDQNMGLIDQLIEMQPVLDQIMTSITTFTQNGDPFWGLTAGSDGLTQLQEDLNTVLTTTGLAGAYAQEAIENLNAAHQAGILSADQYAAAVHYLATVELPALSNEVTIAGYQIGLLADDLDSGQASADEFAESLGLAAVEARDFTKAAELATNSLQEDTEARTRNADAGRIQADALYEVSEALQEGGNAAREWAIQNAALLDQFVVQFERLDTLIDRTIFGEDRSLTYRLNIESDAAGGRPVARPEADALYGAAQAAEVFSRRGQETQAVIAELGTLVAANVLPWAEYQQALAGVADQFGLLSTNAQLFQAAGIDAPSLDVAVNLQMGGDDLGRIFNSIVGQTTQMSQQLGQVESWADKLIGDPGTWSQLDQLLADGRISLEQYTAAQEAQVRISTDVENAQQDLLAVQANLAPVIADATRQQAEYIDSLQDMDTQSQLAALGFMDQAESARALEIAQLAAASSTEGQRDATTAMIQEMVNADPVLGAMLEKMGLISIGADGTVTVNFEDAVNANESIDNLTASIEDLTALLGDIFNIDTDTDAPESQRLIEELTGAVNAIPDKVTTYIEVVDNASYQAQLAREALALLDGYTVTTYINTVGTKTPGLATGGTIPFEARPVVRDLPAFAGGGTMALVGEAGPEIVRLPTGAQVTNAPATRSMLATASPRDGGVNFYGPVTLQPSGSDAHVAIRRAALSRARGY